MNRGAVGSRDGVRVKSADSIVAASPHFIRIIREIRGSFPCVRHAAEGVGGDGVPGEFLEERKFHGSNGGSGIGSTMLAASGNGVHRGFSESFKCG